MRYLNKAQKLKRSSLLYQKVKRAVVKELKKQGKELSSQELTALLREVYPVYKGFAAKDVKVASIRELTASIVTTDPSIKGQEYENPLNISAAKLSSIEWWGIDDYLSVELRSLVEPKNVRFQVNAGEYGSTSIMDLFNANGSMHYEYFTSGLNQIVEDVRKAVDNKSGAEWVGEPVLRPGFKDDGMASSYFVQFTLYIDGQQVPPSEIFEEPQQELPPLSKEETRERLEETIKRRKQLEKERREAQQMKEIRGRRRPGVKEKITKPEEPKPEKPAKPAGKVSRSQNIQDALDRQERMLNDIERLFDKKILTKKEFLAERQKIIDQTTLAISKFDKGGKV